MGTITIVLMVSVTITLKGAIMAFILGLGIGFVLLIGLAGLAAYILMALALMTMADRKGIENAWLAFIPVVNMFVLGSILEELDFFGTKIEKPEMILPILALASFFFSSFGFVGSVISLFSFVVSLLAYFQLVEMYKKGSGIFYLVLLVLLAPVGAWLLYSIRENTPITVE